MISVVVPVYKVEKYLAKCIDSIIAQTYTDLEILLIDDGSPDNCPAICDEYAKKDRRIRVIHQANQGLAEVRNVGIREAKGEYLQFVDSDDWIEPDMIEKCYNYMNAYDADIVCFRSITEYEDGRQIHYGLNYPPRLMESAEALSVLFVPQYVDVLAWNKLMKLKLLRGIEYPIGKLYEDMFTTYKIIARASKILCLSNEFYHYLKRDMSISHYNLSSRTYDLLEATQKCFDFAIKQNEGNELARKNLLCGLWFWKIVMANYMIKANSPDEKYILQLQKDIKAGIVMSCPLLSVTRKIQFLLFKYNQKLYRLIYTRLKKA